MKSATAEIWDGQDSLYQLRVTDYSGDKAELALCSPEPTLDACWQHIERLRQQTGAEIWVKDIVRAFSETGEPIIIRPYFYDTETRRNSENKVTGLGRFAYTEGEFQGKKYRNWYYKAPSRPWTQISAEFSNCFTTPPLPQPRANWRTCGCREHQHTCGACSKPYWIEMHGVADGYCTYCYYAG